MDTCDVKFFAVGDFNTAQSGIHVYNDTVFTHNAQQRTVRAAAVGPDAGVILHKHQSVAAAPGDIQHVTAEVILGPVITAVSIGNRQSVVEYHAVPPQEGNPSDIGVGRNGYYIIPVTAFNESAPMPGIDSSVRLRRLIPSGCVHIAIPH